MLVLVALVPVAGAWWVFLRARAEKRLSGLVALAAMCFLPSTILYSNFAASEPLFTFAPEACAATLISISAAISPQSSFLKRLIRCTLLV